MRHLRQTGLAGLIAGLAVAGGGVRAQDEGDGGVWLRLSLSERLEAAENADLDEVSAGRTFRSDTRLGFALSSETRRAFLGLTLGGTIRWLDAPGTFDDLSFDFDAPSGALRYRLSSAQSRLEASLTADSEDISLLRALVPDVDGGIPVLPEDITDLRADGTRQRIGGEIALRFGIEGPAEYGFRLDALQTDYSDTAGTTLVDSERFGAETDMRLQIASDRALTGRLRYSVFDEEDEPQRETWSLDLGVVQERPAGEISVDLSVVQIEEGTRVGLSSGWSRELPSGALSFRLGVARAAEGDVSLSGSAIYSQTLPNGSFDLRLDRSFAAGAEDEETVLSVASAQYTRALSPRTELRLDAVWALSETLATGAEATRTEFGLGLSHALNRDWALTTGYRRIGLDDEAVSGAVSDTIYISFDRALSVRF